MVNEVDNAVDERKRAVVRPVAVPPLLAAAHLRALLHNAVAASVKDGADLRGRAVHPARINARPFPSFGLAFALMMAWKC